MKTQLKCKYCNFETDSFRPRVSLAAHTWRMHSDRIKPCPGYCDYCKQHCQFKIDTQTVSSPPQSEEEQR